MRVFGPGGTRSLPLDRNPLPVKDGIDASFAGGTLDTTTVTYTVPASRRARIETWSIHAVVETAFAAGQTASVLWELTTPAPTTVGGGVRFIAASALGTERTLAGGVFELPGGGTLRLSINISAGAGALRVIAGFHGTEYDV